MKEEFKFEETADANEIRPKSRKSFNRKFFLLIKPQKVKTFQVDVGNMSDQRQRQVDRKKMK